MGTKKPSIWGDPWREYLDGVHLLTEFLDLVDQPLVFLLRRLLHSTAFSQLVTERVDPTQRAQNTRSREHTRSTEPEIRTSPQCYHTALCNTPKARCWATQHQERMKARTKYSFFPDWKRQKGAVLLQPVVWEHVITGRGTVLTISYSPDS